MSLQGLHFGCRFRRNHNLLSLRQTRTISSRFNSTFKTQTFLRILPKMSLSPLRNHHLYFSPKILPRSNHPTPPLQRTHIPLFRPNLHDKPPKRTHQRPLSPKPTLINNPHHRRQHFKLQSPTSKRNPNQSIQRRTRRLHAKSLNRNPRTDGKTETSGPSLSLKTIQKKSLNYNYV